MISVVIPTLNSERLLVPTLAALVPGSAEGLVREVLLADGGSADETATIADAAGCEFHTLPGASHDRVRAAAKDARGEWLLVLGPGSVLDEGWTREVAKFIDSAERTGQAQHRAATFRLAIDDVGVVPRLKEFAAVARFAFVRRARADQGLLIAKESYASGGPKAVRLVMLRTRVVVPA